jgi:hypothetical protein
MCQYYIISRHHKKRVVLFIVGCFLPGGCSVPGGCSLPGGWALPGGFYTRLNVDLGCNVSFCHLWSMLVCSAVLVCSAMQLARDLAQC